MGASRTRTSEQDLTAGTVLPGNVWIHATLRDGRKLIEMVMEGVAPSMVKDELNANAAMRERLEAKLAATEEPPPLLHPEMARIYREKVSALARALQEPNSRPEAAQALRGLVDAIVLTPDEAGETLQK